MEALRIEFELASPMTEASYPIHLDALVAWAAVEAAREHGDPEPLSAQDHLPLAKDGGVWCASALHLERVDAPFTVAQTKRTDMQQFSEALYGGVLKKAPNKLNLGQGPWRQALYFSQCQQVARATAWCVGEKDELLQLLSRVDYIGARRRNGRGRVVRLVIQPDASATDRWRERIMADRQDGYVPIQAVTSPPYWDRGRAAAAWAHPDIV